MKNHTPFIPPVEPTEPRWKTDNEPKCFTGTAYSDGSTTINHAFPDARRSGYAAVIIKEELRDSDVDPEPPDDHLQLENEERTDQLGQQQPNIETFTPHSSHNH